MDFFWEDIESQNIARVKWIWRYVGPLNCSSLLGKAGKTTCSTQWFDWQCWIHCNCYLLLGIILYVGEVFRIPIWVFQKWNWFGLLVCHLLCKHFWFTCILKLQLQLQFYLKNEICINSDKPTGSLHIWTNISQYSDSTKTNMGHEASAILACSILLPPPPDTWKHNSYDAI